MKPKVDYILYLREWQYRISGYVEVIIIQAMQSKSVAYCIRSLSMGTFKNWFNFTLVFDELNFLPWKRLPRGQRDKNTLPRFGRPLIEVARDSWHSKQLKSPRGMVIFWNIGHEKAVGVMCIAFAYFGQVPL